MISSAGLATVIFSSSVLLATAAFGQKATLSAEIKGTDGRPANAAEIRIERQDAKMAPIIARTDRGGKWSTSNLPAGTYKVTTMVAGGGQSSQIVQARANKKMLVTFDLKGNAGKSAAVPAKKKTYVWVDTTTGTHMGGHFEEVGGQAEQRGPHVGNLEGASGESLARMPQTANGKSGTGGL